MELTALECRLMELFLHNRGIVLTRERILERIWDAEERFVESRTLNVTVRRLRLKVEENPEEPVYIKTGVLEWGYKWGGTNRDEEAVRAAVSRKQNRQNMGRWYGRNAHTAFPVQ